MIQRITHDDTTLSRAEREYIDHLTDDNENPAKRHRIIIRCWVNDDDGYQPVYLYEPTSETLQLLMSEFAPIWAKSQVMPYCVCPQRYFQALVGLETVKAATSTYIFPAQALVDLKGHVPRSVTVRLKGLVGKTFFSQQDAADALVQLFEGVLTEKQITEHGDTVLSYLKQSGDAEAVRQTRIAELQGLLDEFHGNIPQKPMPPTDNECPFCHLPHRYSLIELFPHEQQAIQRMLAAIVGAPVMLRDIPKVLEALEMWIFASDTELFSKKNSQATTVTGMMMARLREGIQTMRTALLTDTGTTDSPDPNETGTSSSSTSSPPPSTPDSIPPDK